MSSLSYRARSIARRIRQLIRFWKLDRSKNSPIDIGLLRQGFLSLRNGLYPFDRYEPRWFLSDWAVENHFFNINSSFVKAQLNDKLSFHLLLRELGSGGKMAPLIGVVCDGEFTSFSDFETIEAALLLHPRIVVKPVDGLGGFGIYVLEKTSDLRRQGTYILEAAIRQHEYANNIFPGSVNTMRIMTVRASGSEPFIIGAAHRFGVKKSAPVDNISSGGISTCINLHTGRMSAAWSQPGRFAQQSHAQHPETLSPIEGVVIPHWDEIKAFVIDLARKVPGLKLAGWDVSLTAEGPRLIEANGNVPNPELFQYDWPLLLNPQTRAFFANHGVIPRKLADDLTQLEALGKAPKHAAVP
ncbi:MAG TPA: sugar-transfer associated ATP-grasp domain-containing protein [Opitutaceae bacterium]